jgi:hypothetical protein
MRAQSARTTGYGSRACREQSKQYMNSPVYEQPAAPSLAKKTPRSRSRVSTYSSGCGAKITNRARRNQRQMGASRPSVVDHPNDERSTDHGREERSRFFEERKLGSVSLSRFERGLSNCVLPSGTQVPLNRCILSLLLLPRDPRRVGESSTTHRYVCVSPCMCRL